MKSTIPEMENSLEGFKGRFKQAEESVDLKIDLWKLLRLRNRKKGLKKSKQSLRGLWNTIKQTNIHIVGVQKKKRERKKGAERIFEETMAENVPNLMKDINMNIQEAQQTPSKINSKKPTPQHDQTFKSQ